MKHSFSRRVQFLKKSFLGEILQAAADPSIISFAGGLPNPEVFPIKEIQEACNIVLETSGPEALQYSTTEGYYPLREYIAKRYQEKKNVTVKPEEILITNGSQQAIDIIGRVFIDEGDKILIESPGYLGAILAFSIYNPHFLTVPLHDHGVDTRILDEILASNPVKFFYGVPNFHNPSGITYSLENRREVAKVLNKHATVFIEDDPYGELRLVGKDLPPLRNFLDDNAIMLGSFSKTVVPSFRLGWIYAPKEIMEKLIIVKEAADLHTNYFSQRVVYEYLMHNDIEAHIERSKILYKKKRDTMLAMIKEHFPPEVKYTQPESGMFIWVTLPEGMSSLELFNIAIKKKVSFVPGHPFFVDSSGERCLRLNYTRTDEATTEIGIKYLGLAIKELMKQKK